MGRCRKTSSIRLGYLGDCRGGYRDYLGGYTSVSQLKDIKGIGDATFAKIEPYVTV